MTNSKNFFEVKQDWTRPENLLYLLFVNFLLLATKIDFSRGDWTVGYILNQFRILLIFSTCISLKSLDNLWGHSYTKFLILDENIKDANKNVNTSHKFLPVKYFKENYFQNNAQRWLLNFRFHLSLLWLKFGTVLMLPPTY